MRKTERYSCDGGELKRINRLLRSPEPSRTANTSPPTSPLVSHSSSIV
jgi:hypothetical protein